MPSYELQYSGEHATTTAQWVEGCLPEVVSTSAMTPLVESGELPELSREEALEFFAVDPGAAPLTPQLEETINLLDAVLAPGQAGNAALDRLLGATRRALNAFDGEAGDIDAAALDSARVVAVALGEPVLRDLITYDLLSAPQQATRLLKALAARLTGAARASALCLYALVAGPAGLPHRVGMALTAAREADPTHRMTRLVIAAQVQFDPAEVRRRALVASLQALDAHRDERSARQPSAEPPAAGCPRDRPAGRAAS